MGRDDRGVTLSSLLNWPLHPEEEGRINKPSGAGGARSWSICRLVDGVTLPCDRRRWRKRVPEREEEEERVSKFDSREEKGVRSEKGWE